MKPIGDVARAIGIDPAALEPYGHYKAKLPLSAFKDRPNRGKLVLVSAITPTPRARARPRRPSGWCRAWRRRRAQRGGAARAGLGPVFGMKGGGRAVARGSACR